MTEGLIERGEYKIKLGLQNAPVMAEQLALFDMGGDAPVYEAPADTATGILAPAARCHRRSLIWRSAQAETSQQCGAHRRILYAGTARAGK